MPVRAALLPGLFLLCALLLAGQVSAQPVEARPEEEPIPAEPAPAPPAAADLSGRPPAATAPQPAPAAIRPFTLPPGMEALPQGAWRLRFAQGTETPPRTAEPALAELGRRLAAVPEGRVVLLAQASGPADVSTARRLSLARGLAVKEALVAGGLPPTRIDIRPMGRTEDAIDAVDVQPPGVRRDAP